MNRPMIDASEWADYIKLYRRVHDLTQKEFGELVGCTRRCVSEWESQKTFPQKNKQIKLMELFLPILPELARELAVKEKIQKIADQQSSIDLLETALVEYKKVEPVKYNLIMQIGELDDDIIQAITVIVEKMLQQK